MVLINDHAEMLAFGRSLAESLRVGDVVLLHGDLGAGKTTLVQGIAAALGVEGTVQSPTFGLVAEHAARAPDGEAIIIHHLDLYRLESPEELEALGYDQFLAPVDGVALIEWPERAEDWLPDRFTLISITHADGGGRLVNCTSHG
jgi:tRNA threonylcarbamoyl adenosine modification protein YjeE